MFATTLWNNLLKSSNGPTQSKEWVSVGGLQSSNYFGSCLNGSVEWLQYLQFLAISSDEMAAHSRLHALLQSSMWRFCFNRFNRIWKDILFTIEFLLQYSVYTSQKHVYIRRFSLWPTMETIFPSNLRVALLQIMYQILSSYISSNGNPSSKHEKLRSQTSALNHPIGGASETFSVRQVLKDVLHYFWLSTLTHTITQLLLMCTSLLLTQLSQSLDISSRLLENRNHCIWGIQVYCKMLSKRQAIFHHNESIKMFHVFFNPRQHEFLLLHPWKCPSLQRSRHTECDSALVLKSMADVLA